MIRLFSPQDFDQFRLWLPLKTYLFNSTSFENSENILNYFFPSKVPTHENKKCIHLIYKK